MYIKNFYCCSICNTPYEKEEQAFVCDNEPIDPKYAIFHKGDNIFFSEETYNTTTKKVDKMFSKGIIEGKIISPGDKIHNVCLVVNCGSYIRIVSHDKRGQLMSYPQGKHGLTYLDNLDLK